MRAFYEPTAEHLTRLSGPWCASYSGGKDSSAVVTLVEFWRRAGWISCDKPRLSQADTLVEDTKLAATSQAMRECLTASGWECGVVVPELHERLYNQILGRGLPPIHPGVRRMRWCTRSTKIDPMNRWVERAAGPSTWLTGLRLGESAIRDGKILKSMGCSAGGECGIPEPDERHFSPILEWTTCQVIDWLSGNVASSVREVMADVFAVTRLLVDAYEFESKTVATLWGEETEVSSARFGCTGCPAIGAERTAPRGVVARYGVGSPIGELYDVWWTARLPHNRLWGGARQVMGPIRMAARKVLFERVMDIQRRAGVTLITPEDEVFIRQCWENKVYPRGWSEADEANEAPLEPLYVDAE